MPEPVPAGPADPRHVAFFRNLNLGQRRSPTRAQLLDAFVAAGAIDAESVQANGTVVFRADRPVDVARAVCTALTPVCGYGDIAIVRRAQWVCEVAGRLRAGGSFAAGAEVSVFDLEADFPESLPWRPAGRAVTVVVADACHAVVINDQPDRSHGTFLLERLLGIPVTSRGVNTWLRLAGRLAAE